MRIKIFFIYSHIFIYKVTFLWSNIESYFSQDIWDVKMKDNPDSVLDMHDCMDKVLNEVKILM